MASSISGVGSGQAANQRPQQVVPPKPKPKVAAPEPQKDVVTISAKSRQAMQLKTAGSTPAEEAKESPVEKTLETQVGKK